MKRTFLKDLNKELNNKKVLIKGFAHYIKDLAKVKFIILKDFHTNVQCVAVKGKTSDKIFNDIPKIHPESSLEIQGMLKENKESKKGFEIIIEKLTVINPAETPLPIDMREETTTALDKRIDWRCLDLRRERTKAIFKIQAVILESFREFCRNQGFIELICPSIISASSEGGTDVFPIKYFEREAYLAQSPQLYKQMFVAGGVEKVFLTGPIFRAEKHNTPKHLNESRQLDIEAGFIGSKEALEYLEKSMVYMMEKVKENNKEELKILNFDFKIPKLPFRRVTYKECIELLQKKGSKIKQGDDFDPENEKKISEIIGIDNPFFIIDWPTEMKPFYAMPYEDKPSLTKSYDLMYGGIELSSGAQRIHTPDLLIKQLESKGLNPKDFKTYVDAFRYGCPPHAGWSIGLERITMVLTGQKNIRACTIYPRDRDRLEP